MAGLKRLGARLNAAAQQRRRERIAARKAGTQVTQEKDAPSSVRLTFADRAGRPLSAAGTRLSHLLLRRR